MMPDGDVIYYHVGKHFATPYKALCDDAYEDKPDEVAEMTGTGLRNRLKRYGQQPILLIQKITQQLHQGFGQPINFEQESIYVDQIALELMGNKRGISLATEACKEIAFQLSTAESIAYQNDMVIKKYIDRILEADFFERIPLLIHHDGIDHEIFQKRLVSMKNFLAPKVEHIIYQLEQAWDVNKLRKKRAVAFTADDFEKMDMSLSSFSIGKASHHALK